MTERNLFRPADPYGLSRVLAPTGVLPQQATALNASLPLAADELLIEVECLNIDSASFKQIADVNGNDPIKMSAHIEHLIQTKGKQHNPITGSGGMLIGTVTQIGPEFPAHKKPVNVGDRIATLVSLTLTPIRLQKMGLIEQEKERVYCTAQAILFASGIFAKLPLDLPETLALSALDVAGAPAQTRRMVKPGNDVVIVGGGGKSGILCLYEAKKSGAKKVIAVEYSKAACEVLRKFSFVDHVIEADARNAIHVQNEVKNFVPLGADVVINVTNIPNTEMSCILSTKEKGLVYFFSMATSFTQAALGAEGVGADVNLQIGNGFAEGHADCVLNILRQSAEVKSHFMAHFL